jgi:hypothetical protein
MENENINFKIKRTAVSRSSLRDLILLEPINSNHIENYHYDIRLLRKDFSVVEIDDDLHYVYADEISRFFKKHEETKIVEVPTRLFMLNEALEPELI